MRDLSKNLVTLVIKVNFRKDKYNLLTKLRDKSEEMKVNIMIGKEINIFKILNNSIMQCLLRKQFRFPLKI